MLRTAALLAAALWAAPTEAADSNLHACIYWDTQGPTYDFTDISGTLRATAQDGRYLLFRLCGGLPEHEGCGRSGGWLQNPSHGTTAALWNGTLEDGTCSPQGIDLDADNGNLQYGVFPINVNAGKGWLSAQSWGSYRVQAQWQLNMTCGPETLPVLTVADDYNTVVHWQTERVCSPRTDSHRYGNGGYIAFFCVVLALVVCFALGLPQRLRAMLPCCAATKQVEDDGDMGLPGWETPGPIVLWLRQLDALVRKNLLCIRRGPALMIAIVIAPSLSLVITAVVVTLIGQHGWTHVRLEQIIGAGITMVSFAVVHSAVLHVVVHEKQSKVTSLMRMIGVSEMAYWLSWIAAWAVPALASALLAAFVGSLTNLQILNATNPLLVVLTFFATTWAFCAMACFTSSYVSNPILVHWFVFAAAVVMTVTFAGDMTWLQADYGDRRIIDLYRFDKTIYAQGAVTILLFFCPWMNFARIWSYFARRAGPGMLGTDWGALSSAVQNGCVDCRDEWGPQPAVAQQLAFLFGSVAAFLLLTWYLAQVVGGELRQPVYFFLLPEYWTGRTRFQPVQEGDTIARVQQESLQGRSIKLHKLSKAYEQVTALKEVSLTIEQDSIFAVLGQNGAGKTTLVHTLCGFHSPTHGEAFVQGHSIREEMWLIQRKMGFCPQYDCLWDCLTALEHIRFYIRIKGAPQEDVERLSRQQLRNCDLLRDANVLASRFSGGMRRRLSIAIAATGDPEVIFLDEPTTGMDPLHRRQVWRLIQQLKHGRIVALTTHLTEEADSLADSIAILHAGRLQAYGTPMFLKNHFGKGYQISLQAADGVEPETVEDYVREKLPGSEAVASSAGNIRVSVSTSRRALIPRFFRHIEESRGLVKSWGLSNTTLEEVFLRLCASSTEVNAGGNDVREETSISELVRVRSEVEAQLLDPAAPGADHALLLVHPGAPDELTAEAERWPHERLLRGFRTVVGALRGILYPGTARGAPEEAEPSDAECGALDADGEPCLLTTSPRGTRARPARKAAEQPAVRIPVSRNEMESTFWSQSQAMILKVIWLWRRHPKMLIFNAFLTVVGVLFTVLMRKIQGSSGKVTAGDATLPVIFFMLISYLLLPGTMYAVAQEKATRLYFMLKLQGLWVAPYWVSHYVSLQLISLCSTLLFVICGYAFGVPFYNNANPLLFIMLAVVAGHSNTALSVFLTSVIRNPKVLSSFVFNIYIIPAVAVAVVGQFVDSFKHGWFLIPSLASVRAIQLLMVYGNHVIEDFDYTTWYKPAPGPSGEEPYPWSWDNATEASVVHSEFAAAIWIPLLFCTVVLFPVGLLLHAAIPNEFGVTELQWRPLDRAVGWIYRNLVGMRADPDEVNSPRGDAAHEVQAAGRDGASSPSPSASPHGPPAVSLAINDLTHRYATGKLAVSGLSLDVYEGEIFGLLGPNGAGKTTVLSVLSGLMRPSGGDAKVAGFDCIDDPEQVHRRLGVCPQFDAVWDDLTVQQHLQLFAVLKGCPRSRIKGLVQSLVEAVQLDGDSLEMPAKKLSGGMRRRLSIAIALVGGPSVLLLDEPSTGLDPDARRKMWDLIERERGQGRSIVLTTHSMEEADTLSNRIAIMSRGRLRCVGEPLDLKKRYGGGFRLGLMMATADAEVSAQLLQTLSPAGAELVYRFGKTRTYLLAQRDLALSAVFEVLDAARSEHGIREWDLSQATLDEVFVRVAGEQIS
eukprot:TRINITY_DN785_c0_g1_i9.p1 TRINITY_DN785_c0_g1~~TRINITY_DN785_c0_g1_i9.p1  ORF type:complete len:1700 (+),score=542.22 TRINITY_DN785_c0_g1_i9:971-6070(+)